MLPRIHKAWGSVLQNTEVVPQACKLRIRRWRHFKEDLEVVLDYTASLRISWAV